MTGSGPFEERVQALKRAIAEGSADVRVVERDLEAARDAFEEEIARQLLLAERGGTVDYKAIAKAGGPYYLVRTVLAHLRERRDGGPPQGSA